MIFTGEPGILEYAYTGESNFVIFVYGESGGALLVNETTQSTERPCSVIRPAIVEIEAEPGGEWWLNLRP